MRNTAQIYTAQQRARAHGLAPEMRPVLVKRCPMQDLSLEGVVDLLEKLYHQTAKNELWWNAVGEQLV